MTLIIRDELVGPPTWFASFRDLTLFVSTFHFADGIVIETPPELTDLYYRWLRTRGGMDFIDDFVRIGIEEGVRLDRELRYPRTVLTDRIIPENTHRLVSQIRFMTTV